MLEDLGFLVKSVCTSVYLMQICSPALVLVSLSVLLQVLLAVSVPHALCLVAVMCINFSASQGPQKMNGFIYRIPVIIHLCMKHAPQH